MRMLVLSICQLFRQLLATLSVQTAPAAVVLAVWAASSGLSAAAWAAPSDAGSGASIGRTQEGQVLYGSSSQGGRGSAAAAAATAVQGNRLDATDMMSAQLWGLTTDEMVRAKALLQGPRASFSVPNISPVEALGIHARSDSERRKYAELMARALHDDVKRTLAFQAAFQEAMTRLFGNEPVVDFSHVPKVAVPVGAADAANVPRSVVIDVAPSAAGNKAAGGQKR